AGSKGAAVTRDIRKRHRAGHRVHQVSATTLFDLVKEICLTKSKNRKASQEDVPARIREVLRFDRFYSRRLREAAKAARVNALNVAESGVFHELLDGPYTPGWLSWRLGLDPGQLSRTLEKLELMRHITVCGSGDDRR